MKTLSEAIAAMAHDLHPDTATSIASALEKRPNEDPIAILKEHFGGSGTAHLTAMAGLLGLHRSISPRDVAMLLRGASASLALRSHEKSELVWSGPNTGIVPIRKTEQVLIGLIEESQHELFLVSFVAYGAASIMKALAQATSRGVKVQILMERSQDSGGTLSFDSIAQVRQAVPEANIFIWAEDEDGDKNSGAVHAKCAVADGRSAFITSANLTGKAMLKNMELGVVFHNGHLPKTLHTHLKSLVTTNVIRGDH